MRLIGLFKRFLTNNLAGISSGGGHLFELMACIPDHSGSKLFFITQKNVHTKSSMDKAKCLYIIDPHMSMLKYLINFFQAFKIFLKLRPRVVISTGAGIAIPFILISKFFGSKIIFIETGAMITVPSKTGKLIYKYADIFFIQYEPLLKFYPDAILGSLQ